MTTSASPNRAAGMMVMVAVAQKARNETHSPTLGDAVAMLAFLYCPPLVAWSDLAATVARLQHHGFFWKFFLSERRHTRIVIAEQYSI